MFPQTGSSALFMNLSEDQQEFVTGGAFTESQMIDYTETHYSKKAQKILMVRQDTFKKSQESPVFLMDSSC